VKDALESKAGQAVGHANANSNNNALSNSQPAGNRGQVRGDALLSRIGFLKRNICFGFIKAPLEPLNDCDKAFSTLASSWSELRGNCVPLFGRKIDFSKRKQSKLECFSNPTLHATTCRGDNVLFGSDVGRQKQAFTPHFSPPNSIQTINSEWRNRLSRSLLALAQRPTPAGYSYIHFSDFMFYFLYLFCVCAADLVVVYAIRVDAAGVADRIFGFGTQLYVMERWCYCGRGQLAKRSCGPTVFDVPNAARIECAWPRRGLQLCSRYHLGSPHPRKSTIHSTHIDFFGQGDVRERITALFASVTTQTAVPAGQCFSTLVIVPPAAEAAIASPAVSKRECGAVTRDICGAFTQQCVLSSLSLLSVSNDLTCSISSLGIDNPCELP
jgi:hypothetical protein